MIILLSDLNNIFGDYIVFYFSDDVGVVVKMFELGIGIVVDCILRGYKIVFCDMDVDMVVLKFGNRIGFMIEWVCKGWYVYVYNLVFWEMEMDIVVGCMYREFVLFVFGIEWIFMGYCWVNGLVGICNYIVVFISVNCLVIVVRLIV